MKRFIRGVLNTVPRPLMQRMAGWAIPLMGLIYLGKGRECPICGCKRRKFLPYGYVISRENALCPNCLALERHRLMWLYLERETNLFEEHPMLLHIAPEVSLMKPLERHYHSYPSKYLTADLESPLARVHFDVQDIPLEDNYADVIFCNHILEHVESDHKALSELYRIMKSGGWGIILSPIDYDREHTFEDDSITDTDERTRIFGQYDHRRVYGRDYADRLRAAGFTVEAIRYCDHINETEQQLYSLPLGEVIYKVIKP